MVLAIYQARLVWNEQTGSAGPSLLKVLVKDQAIYFIAYVFSGSGPVAARNITSSALLTESYSLRS